MKKKKGGKPSGDDILENHLRAAFVDGVQQRHSASRSGATTTRRGVTKHIRGADKRWSG